MSFIIQPNRFFDKRNGKCYFKFDESSGNLINKATAALGWPDTLGVNADSQAPVGVTRNQAGKITDSYGFDGVNDHIDIGSFGNKSQFSFMHNLTAKFTYNAWIKETAQLAGSLFFNLNNQSTNIGVGITHFANGSIEVAIKRGVGGGTPVISAVTSVGFFPADNLFHMLTIRWDFLLASDNLIITLDGDIANQEKFTKTANPPTNNAPNFEPRLGETPNGTTDLTGNMDELVIFNSILTDDQVKSLHNGGIARAL